MGAIWFDQNKLISFLSELIGYKSGLALNRDNMINLLNENNAYQELLKGSEEHPIRIRSEEIDGLVATLLHKVGNLSTPTPPSVVDLSQKYAKDPKKNEIYKYIIDLLIDNMKKTDDVNDSQFAKVFVDVVDTHGELGADIFFEISQFINHIGHTSPWSKYRFKDWDNILELDQLFKSESMNVSEGEYFDQRFIDYLYENFSDIDNINWRQFEFFVAEYFHKNEWKVKLGPGRNDDGVDIRISKINALNSAPEVILIQCKRQKDKICKMVVKALWADIVDKNAKSGLIVTTSALSPGAKKVCQARAYSINHAERENLKKWIESIKTLGSGVFMSE